MCMCLARKIVFVSLTPLLLLFPQFQCFQKCFLTVYNTHWPVLSYEELQEIDSFHLFCGKLRNWSKQGAICLWNLLGTKVGISVLGALQNLLVEMTSGGLFQLHIVIFYYFFPLRGKYWKIYFSSLGWSKLWRLCKPHHQPNKPFPLSSYLSACPIGMQLSLIISLGALIPNLDYHMGQVNL